jgi:hypothetical protein
LERDVCRSSYLSALARNLERGKVRLACDNSSVVDVINKHFIKVYDIQILQFWIPSEENIVADAASRYDSKKLANLGLQVCHNLPRLRQKLHSFFTSPSKHLAKVWQNPQNL